MSQTILEVMRELEDGGNPLNRASAIFKIVEARIGRRKNNGGYYYTYLAPLKKSGQVELVHEDGGSKPNGRMIMLKLGVSARTVTRENKAADSLSVAIGTYMDFEITTAVARATALKQLKEDLLSYLSRIRGESAR